MRNIDVVIAENHRVGGTFFDKRTVCYFKNKILPTLYGNGKYFISYDLMDDGTKLYTVRKVLESGLIGHEGPRNGHETEEAARAAIRELVGDGVVTA